MMIKFLTVIVVTLVLFINILPLSALARSEGQGGGWLRGQGDGRGNVWVDTSRWETRRVQVEAARAARYEDRTVLVSPARTETRVIPEVRETRTRWVPPVIETRFVMIEPGRPAVPEQGHWASRTIPAVTRTDRVWIPPVTGTRTVSYERTPGRFEDRIVVVTPERTERRWVVTRAAQPAQWGWIEVPNRVWIQPTTREERFRDIEVYSWVERVRVSDGRWTFRSAGVGQNPGSMGHAPLPVPIWIPPVYQNVMRTATQEVWRTRTVNVPGRWETRVDRRWGEIRPAQPEEGRYVTRTIPAVTRTDRVWIPPVTGTRTVSYERTPGRFEDRIVVVTPERTERRWVVTRAAQPAVPEQWGFRDFVVAPGRNETYSVVVAPATTVVEHIPAVTRIESVLVEAARPARYEDRAEFVRDGRNENITGNVTLERDRMYVFTGLRRPPGKTHDMVMNVKHNLNATVTNITAVHVIDRFRGLGQMHVVPVSSNTRPDGSVDLNFNYTRPGTAESTLYVRLHLANGGFVEVEADIPVNGLTFTERSNAPPLRLDAAVAKEGTLGF